MMLGLKKIEVIALGVLFIISPALVSAQSVADLQAQINALLLRVRELQAQLAHLQDPASYDENSMRSPPGIGRCLVLARALHFGVRGDDVREIQKLLIDEGLLSADSATGYFGPATEAALKKLQAAHGIVGGGSPRSTGWGMAGPLTRAWLASRCRAVSIPARIISTSSLPPYSPTPAPSPSPTPTPAPPPSSTPAATTTVAVSVSTSTVSHGQDLAISWSSQNAPNNSAVALSLAKAASGGSIGYVGIGKATSGTLTWRVPTSATSVCADCPTLQTAPAAGEYFISAQVYSPVGAWLSGFPPANPISPTFHAKATSSTFTVSAVTGSAPSPGQSDENTVQPPPYSVPNTSGSCATPWGSYVVASGQVMTGQPWFSNGLYSYSVTTSYYKCTNGTWTLQSPGGGMGPPTTPYGNCDEGNVRCTGTAAPSTANFAGALFALESALDALARLMPID